MAVMLTECSLPLAIFVISLVSAIVVRLTRTRGSHGGGAAHHVKVLIAVPASEDWNELLWDYMRAAVYPQDVQFGILVECLGVRDADVDVDSILRPRVRVHHAVAPHDAPVRDMRRRARRLVRHFQSGNETIVVVADHRARPCPSWDMNLIRLQQQMPAPGLITTPAAATDGIGHFPCVVRSDNTTRRGTSRAFWRNSCEPVRAVCWCPEFTAGDPQTLRDWMAAADDAVFHASPVPLILPDPALEAAHMGREVTDSAPGGVVGVADVEDEHEAMMKFGSIRSAKLAIRFLLRAGVAPGER